MMKHHPHPGEILRETVFVPIGIGVAGATERLRLPRAFASA
jgi:plasmid maintenance system antidote protein VapI